MEPTEDPAVIIEDRGPGWVRYRALADGECWEIHGICIACGACEVGNDNLNLEWRGEVGEPGACIDLKFASRLDIPMRAGGPEKLAPHCSLRTERL
jgi:hypothetical protein